MKAAKAVPQVINRFLPKPFSKHTLLRVISELCPLKPD